jgi:KDO2-lipid IV(A) lauroyltransferase
MPTTSNVPGPPLKHAPADPRRTTAPVARVPTRQSRRRKIRAARNAALAGLIGALGGLFRLLPARLAVGCGRALGAGAHALLRRDRRRALEHLALALPELDAAERGRVARGTFCNAGGSFAELAHWPWLRRRLGHVITVDGMEYVDRGLAMGRGLIAVTGHVGNWELLAATFAYLGYGLSVVARRVNDDRFDAMVSGFRRRAGVHTILRDDAAALRDSVQMLRQGRILALLIDQDTRGPGVFVPFFGRLARTSPAAAVLALRTRAPVVTAFIERRGRGHRIRVRPAHGFESGSARRPSAEELTARLTAAIEAQIRRRPTEWVWWHRRWRRQPEGGLALRHSA